MSSMLVTLDVAPSDGWADWRLLTIAATQYWAFGEDLKGLASTLNLLREVIARAEQSIENCRGDVVDALVFDRQSFFEIVGDAERTFLECEQLIKKNKRHAEDAGATRSIEWNVFIQPQVERLRGRILLHNSRLSHALKPLEMLVTTLFLSPSDFYHFHATYWPITPHPTKLPSIAGYGDFVH